MTRSPRPQSFDTQHPTPQMLLWAYQRSLFPMADPRSDAIEWYSPDPRGIIPLDGFHEPASLSRVVRSRRFDVRADTRFESVMRACAAPRSADDLSWIDERLVEAYVELHEQGHAHSVEAWRGDRLVGGLYGVQIGGAFFGESMFVVPDDGGTDASKVCLVHLVGWLRHRGFSLLDTQFTNPHLERLGAIEIDREEYLLRLREAVVQPVSWGEFEVLPR